MEQRRRFRSWRCAFRVGPCVVAGSPVVLSLSLSPEWRGPGSRSGRDEPTTDDEAAAAALDPSAGAGRDGTGPRTDCIAGCSMSPHILTDPVPALSERASTMAGLVCFSPPANNHHRFPARILPFLIVNVKNNPCLVLNLTKQNSTD